MIIADTSETIGSRIPPSNTERLGLAGYEHMSDEVIADEATLKEWIFDKQKAEVIFALEGEREPDRESTFNRQIKVDNARMTMSTSLFSSSWITCK